MESSEADVVISGISGRYPGSDNIEEFWLSLINGNELYSADDRRWPIGYVGLPPFKGTIKDISKVDQQFFRISPEEADSMDPQFRMLYEVVYEAIYDAGRYAFK
ncbi:fatty acid synthase-like protein [Dinothrombium tinctorium]|uniref:Fatty acid synthase-like protein n=1 Tax=Dinothrombium tinctorium TaxID=1965070 RepID=A0A3S3PFV5_9ACAR|nr:fatty acid synthase-like protein [Dinothrombium tinctorium]RWS08682.1 fatty acid synthase-like protein [Dinothrombium tinctorium]RWS08821.1 fatty acid synthase-like protein [Dinothrombium tinctorium]